MLSVIARIRVMSVDVEMWYKDTVEKYRTLAMYNIPVEEEEKVIAGRIEQIWKDLFQEAKMVDRSLVSVKKKFTIITQQQVKSFQAEVDDFNTKFKTEGPATVGTDLDKGAYIYLYLFFHLFTHSSI